MQRSALAAFMLAAAVSLSAQTPQSSAAPRPFETELAKVTWTSPSKADSSVQFAILRADSVSGATQVLWRFRPNVKGPCEWHAATQSIVVVQGSVTVQRAGTSATTLGIGGFAFMPKNTRFQLTVGSAPTIVFATLEGRLDFHPVSASECAVSAK
jgi:quercetin dioxygenase-like cupin family protein